MSTSQTTVRVGLLGCGRIAQFFHLSILAGQPGVELTALAEFDPKLREQAQAKAPSAKAYDDYRALLADPNVDAVVICLPTGMHAQAAIDAFAAGKHVYLEKPVGITMDEAAAVLEAQRGSGKTGMIGFNYRFHPRHLELKKRIQAGEIGNVVAVRSSFCAAKRPLPGWKQKRETGGGVLLDLGTHHADLARFLFDREVVAASGSVRQTVYEGDTATMRMTLDSGLVWDGVFTSQGSDTDTIEVIGDQGMLRLDRYTDTLARNESKPGAGLVKRLKAGIKDAQGAVSRVVNNPGEPSFAGALGAWAKALQSGGAVPVPLEEGVCSLAVVCAAEQSAAKNGEDIDPRGLSSTVDANCGAQMVEAGG